VAAIIDGKAIGKQIQSEVEADVLRLKSERGIIPGLAVVLVGDDPASKLYTSNKAKTCAKLGMHSVLQVHPADISQLELLSVVDILNADPAIHGILVQLPLPPHLDPHAVLHRIDPRKDVDGLHPFNIGLLCSGEPRVIPCTPFGICELLARSNVAISGTEVVILGRSNLVGRPLSVLMSSKHRFGDATVTIAHSRSQNLAAVCRRADILVVAVGKREFVTADMVKPGAVVIDVGTHPARNDNEKMAGDVHFPTVSEVAALITPVPGGVGPMTIAMLMRNTADAAFRITA
jgi:methylenetetrahydrofolate dehydrogenase (NADP+) / methenyltetrahydrofolate cyclohydrolase